MKLKSVLFAAALIFCAQFAAAQVIGITINPEGGYDVIVDVGNNTIATITDDGRLIDMRSMPQGDRGWNSRRGGAQRGNSINHAVRVDYHDNFWNYKAGKVSRIGNVRFDYYDNFYPEKTGKLSSAGRSRIDYYSRMDIFDTQNAGKVKTIDGIKFEYYTARDFFGRSSVGNEYKFGLLKSIDRTAYDYHIVTYRDTGGSGMGGHKQSIQITGPLNFTTRSGVRIQVLNFN